MKNAYNGYVLLGQLPKNAPHFERDKHDNPLIYTGELYCRMPETERPICGHQFVGTTTLKAHIKAMHEKDAYNADGLTDRGNISGERLNKLKSMYALCMTFVWNLRLIPAAFYLDIMKDEDYDKNYIKQPTKDTPSSPRKASGAGRGNNKRIDLLKTPKGKKAGAKGSPTKGSPSKVTKNKK